MRPRRLPRISASWARGARCECGRQVVAAEGGGARLEQGAELFGGHSLEPVPPVPFAGGGEQTVEQAGGGGVGQDGRLVLAAHEVHMIDPEVDRRRFVTRSPASAGPLHERRRPSPQSVTSRKKGPPVGQRLGDRSGVATGALDSAEVLPRRVGDGQLRRAVQEGAGQVAVAEGAERSRELGRRGAVIGHGAALRARAGRRLRTEQGGRPRRRRAARWRRSRGRRCRRPGRRRVPCPAPIGGSAARSTGG